jgi:hypothetical protein
LVSLSIGGWGGSRFFSTAVSDANRSIFVGAVANLVKQYDVDGVEFEYGQSPFLKRVSDPFMIIVGSSQINKRRRVVTRSLIMMPPIIFLSYKT